jgi:hypothetical protein
MTLAVVVMVGAGILLIISAIEDSPIIATFQAIWGGQPISGLAAPTSADTPGNKPKPPGIIS